MTADAFLRRICESPADDAPRLIFADWLDEHGDADRAEFIRVQCELAREQAAVPDNWTEEDETRYCAHRAALRRRERELLLAHFHRWLPAGWVGIELRDTLTAAAVPPVGSDACGLYLFAFRGGFVAKVTLPLAAWVGEECPVCTGYCRPSECWTCFGLGRVNALGPLLMKSAPLERVTFTDGVYMPERDLLAWARRAAGLPQNSADSPDAPQNSPAIPSARSGRSEQPPKT